MPLLLLSDRGLEERMLRLARTAGHTAARDRGVAGFSRLGEHGAIWMAIGGAGAVLDRRRARRWRQALAAVAGTYVVNTAVKLAVGRTRPEPAGLPPLVGTPTALSFPSSHASTSFAGALAYSRMGLPAGALYALAGALAYSRLYLGVHHPSDVLAGALLGTAVASALAQRRREARA